MSENTPHNPQQGDSAAAGYGYDAGARPTQDASLTGQPAQAAQPAQPTQPAQQGAPAQGAQPQQPAGQPIPPVQGQAYPGAQPGQPAQAVYAPAAPNPFVTALRASWDAFLEVFAGKPGPAQSRLAASGLWGWAIPSLLQAIISAFFLTQLSLGFVKFAVRDAYALVAYKITFGQVFLAFLVFLVVSAVVLILRGVQILLTARIGKAPANFSSSMQVVAVSCLPLIPTYILLSLVALFMRGVSSNEGFGFIFVLLGLVMSFAVFSGEALIYLGLNRLGRFAKSPVIMHALLSTAWVLAVMVVYFITFRMLN
ncbi:MULTISPECIES: hypothetical protein [Rothia]|jgi:hypothetical protein|uniref:hypothetical protein n=1 Tax=Rothia TaxID=32207 RepID=UPI00066B310F|nr:MULTISPECIES: hypothetical protein [Rothia]OFM97166.1 hypothetical protein HMPREF2630_00560 [Rothia sp. HMSC072B03]OHP77824.1 hypothetical protein HMPREF2674_04720 [Rothia sp. HMSC062F03]